MCANYTPARSDRLASQFGVDPRDYVFKPEAYPGSMAPIIRLSQDNPDSGQLEVVSAMFGMVPHWAEPKLARQTYNSRTETTATKPSFRNAWKRRQFCLIPAEMIYEPCYETGSPVRWQIAHREGEALAVAGIWEEKPGQDGKPPLLSFSMLTINAQENPVMRRFHKPDDEKRSVVFLRPEQCSAWIESTLEDAPTFFEGYPVNLLEAKPAPRQAPRTAPRPAPRPAPRQASIFDNDRE